MSQPIHTATSRRKQRFTIVAALLLLLLTPALHAASRTWLPNSTFYPRLVRLAYGSARGTIVASTTGKIFQSKDGGHSFTFLGTVPTRRGSTQRCCATLYELPRKIGSLPAGTLLYAASYFSGTTPAIEIHTSKDHGHSWRYLATPVIGGGIKHGLWEPQFSVADNGELVMFWSDETDPCCSQKLDQIETRNGARWQNRKDTVRSTLQAARPGMVVVTRLPDGLFFMTYEICGTEACAAFYRTSKDGRDYGDPSNMGTRIQTAAGQYFEHAPTNTWMPAGASGHGSVLVIGQVLLEANGSVSPQNGRVLFANDSEDGLGKWYTMAAPVKVPDAYDNFCPNYSSALLPSPDGSSLLELASDYNSSHKCVSYFASEPERILEHARAAGTPLPRPSGQALRDPGRRSRPAHSRAAAQQSLQVIQTARTRLRTRKQSLNALVRPFAAPENELTAQRRCHRRPIRRT